MRKRFSTVPPPRVHDTTQQEERFRRRFLSFCLMIMVPVFAVFGFKDFSRGRMLEGVLVLAVCALQVTLFFILNRSRTYTGIMRIVAALLGFTLFYEFFIGGGNGGAYQWMFIMPTSLVFLLGFREGAIWIAVMIVVLCILIFGKIGFIYPEDTVLRFLGSVSTVSVVSCGLEMIRERYQAQLIEEKNALQRAINEIHEFKGWCRSAPHVKKSVMTRDSGPRSKPI